MQDGVIMARLQQAWAEQLYPIVIEYDEIGVVRYCPAAALWTGGRVMGEQLRAAGMGRGHRIGFTGPAGISWIWAMLGCLQEGCVFVPCSPRWSLPTLAERLRQVPVHAVLDADGTLTPFPGDAPREADAVRWILWSHESRAPQAVGASAILAATRNAVGPSEGTAPIRAVLDDGMDADSCFDLVLALLAGAEVHVAPFPMLPGSAVAPSMAPPASPDVR